jgi:hypothetical protein
MQPLAVDASPEVVAEVEFEPETSDWAATAAENLEEIQSSIGDGGIAVDDIDGSPDDEMEIQTGAESLFDSVPTDLSQDDDESER